jgi:hypothetical protein
MYQKEDHVPAGCIHSPEESCQRQGLLPMFPLSPALTYLWCQQAGMQINGFGGKASSSPPLSLRREERPLEILHIAIRANPKKELFV